VLHLADPDMPREAWLRQTLGPRAYAICGLTHTTATAHTMGIISNLLIAPLEDYDALICTSSAVHASVETQLDGVRDYLAREFGPRRRPEAQRVVIPLGVNTGDLAATADQRQAWRARLGIPDEAVVALYVGRFSSREKMNPALMAMALEKTAQATGETIYWLNSGWAESPQEAETYHREARALCPSIHYLHVDGRQADVRFSIWSAADFFISFSDNIQETFGLTPVEAMAAGLPCVVTDWNGYKDTVRHGVDGFRISTTAPRPGAGGDLAFWFASGCLNYLDYVAAASQYVAIDLAEAVVAISALVQGPALRRRMGEQARARAEAVFDWAAIVPQYQALWAEQDARRRAALPEQQTPANPFRPDPFHLFGGYPTRHIGLDDQLALSPGVSWEAASARLAQPLAAYGRLNRPTEPEVAQIFRWLSERPSGRVADLLAEFAPARRPFIRRGVLWIARHDVIEIRPSG
jgi:glycosyltransferase involved in cell wall biosynthesis